MKANSMTTFSRSVLIALLIAATAFAQHTKVGQGIEFSLRAPQPVSIVSPYVGAGTAGSTTYFYWVLAKYAGGAAAPLNPAVITNAPNTLNGSNYVTIAWVPVGAASYDVLRTTTPAFPGSCTCAVATGQTGISVNDTGAALSAYTYTAVSPSTATASLNNFNYATPEIVHSNPVNVPGLQFGSLALLTRLTKFTATLSPVAVAANTCAEQAFTVTGVQVGDVVIAANKPTAQAGLGIGGMRASAANTIAITFCNNTAGAITPTAGETYSFAILQ